MIDILKNMKAILISGLKTNNVFVVPDINIVPVNTFPCYLLKDGDILNNFGMAATADSIMSVDIAILQTSKKAESIIMGDASTQSILALTKQVHVLLDRRLDIDTRVFACHCEKEKQSEYFSSGSVHFQRKILTYIINTHGARPCVGRQL